MEQGKGNHSIFKKQQNIEQEQQTEPLTPLLKSVDLNPFFFGVPWHVVHVFISPSGTRRFFLNISRFPSLAPKVLETTLKTSNWHSWHTFFMMAGPTEFMCWCLMFPMLSMTIEAGSELEEDQPFVLEKPNKQLKAKSRPLAKPLKRCGGKLKLIAKRVQK